MTLRITADSYLQYRDDTISATPRVGHVTLISPARLHAWKLRVGLDPDIPGLPAGSRPDGVQDLGWKRRVDARILAHDLQIPLHEAS